MEFLAPHQRKQEGVGSHFTQKWNTKSQNLSTCFNYAFYRWIPKKITYICTSHLFAIFAYKVNHVLSVPVVQIQFS